VVVVRGSGSGFVRTPPLKTTADPAWALLRIRNSATLPLALVRIGVSFVIESEHQLYIYSIEQKCCNYLKFFFLLRNRNNVRKMHNCANRKKEDVLKGRSCSSARVSFLVLDDSFCCPVSLVCAHIQNIKHTL
jgi:hypothetical protein